MQSETGFPSSHQLKSYVASKSHLKLAVRTVLSADAGLGALIPIVLHRWGPNLVCVTIPAVYICMPNFFPAISPLRSEKTQILPYLQHYVVALPSGTD